LASGSKGNAIWIEAGEARIMVDAGLSCREIERRMALAGLKPARLTAVLVSHEHRDHVAGVGVLARRYRLPIYMNRATLGACRDQLGKVQVRHFTTGEGFELDGLAIRPFSVSHDAADPVGFTFIFEGMKLGLATDLGVATNLVKDHLRSCQALILESNHDPRMLLDGPYPWELKRRVQGRRGHLSNPDAAKALAEIKHAGLAQVVLAHLSETNNLPDKALAEVGPVLSRPAGQTRLTTACQDRPTERYKLGGRQL
jgi:phosphoribosyl 1,2-cyclic phosphodiesterase